MRMVVVDVHDSDKLYPAIQGSEVTLMIAA